jgi:hypothetical protein
MKLLSDPHVAARVALSDLKAMWERQVAVRNDPKATKYQRNYAQAMFDELVDGILRNAKYACKLCISQLPKLPSVVHKKATENNPPSPLPEQYPEFRCAPDSGAQPDMRKVKNMMTKWSDLHHDDYVLGVEYHESEKRAARVDALSDELAQLTHLEHIIFFAKREYNHKMFLKDKDEEAAKDHGHNVVVK